MSPELLEKLAGRITEEEDGFVLWETEDAGVAYSTYDSRKDAVAARKALAVERIRDRLAERVYEIGIDRLVNLASIAGVI